MMVIYFALWITMTIQSSLSHTINNENIITTNLCKKSSTISFQNICKSHDYNYTFIFAEIKSSTKHFNNTNIITTTSRKSSTTNEYLYQHHNDYTNIYQFFGKSLSGAFMKCCQLTWCNFRFGHM